MSLPKNLPSVVTGFGQGNYPAGSDIWSGQPSGAQPVNPFFTPGDPPPAEYLNYLAGLEAKTLQTLMDSLAAAWASNWPNWTPSEDSQINADYVRIGGSQYLPITGQSVWLAAGGAAALPTSGSNTITVLASYDGGQTFQSLNFPSTGFTAHSGDGTLYGIAGDTQGGVVMTANDFTTVPAIHLMALYSGTWHSATPNYGGTFPANIGFDSTNNTYFFGDVTGLYTLPVASTTTTFHSPTGLPSGSGSVLTSLVIQKGNGTLIVVPSTQTGTVWAHSVAYPSPSSTTPAYGTFTVLNTDVVTAGDYGPVDAQYMVAKYNGSTSTSFMRSADGLTWTTTTGTILGNVKFLAVTAGKIWVAARSDGLMWYSTDIGETWKPIVCKIAGNINQFLGFKSNALKNQIAAFGSFSYKNQSTPTESRMMITSGVTG